MASVLLGSTAVGSHIDQPVPVLSRVLYAHQISTAMSPWILSSEGWPLALEFPSFTLLNQLKHINLRLQKSKPASFSRRSALSTSSSSYAACLVVPIVFNFAINPRLGGCSRGEGAERTISTPGMGSARKARLLCCLVSPTSHYCRPAACDTAML